MLNSKLQNFKLKPQIENILFVKDIPNTVQLITNSQDVKPILELLEVDSINILCGSLFVLENNDVYSFCGEVPYLEKRVYFIGNLDDII
jgi:hypothetical protein